MKSRLFSMLPLAAEKLFVLFQPQVSRWKRARKSRRIVTYKRCVCRIRFKRVLFFSRSSRANVARAMDGIPRDEREALNPPWLPCAPVLGPRQ